MEKKRLTKYVWYGSDVDKEGNPILPKVAPQEKHLEGLNRGEFFIHNAAGNTTLWTVSEDGKIVQISGVKLEELEELFLSKIKDDRSKGKISSDKGFEVGNFNEGVVGSGAATFMRDGSSYSEVDFLKVRKKATFTNITIQELKHVGGEIILSPAAMVCSKVEELADGWKCYFNSTDSDGRKVYNEFEVGDQARSQTFNLERNTYYWRLVTSVGDDFIVLSKTDCDNGSDVPKEGDNISLLGNRSNAERQAAIILSAYGSDAPSYKQYNGINSYSLEGKQVTKLSPFGNELTGVLNIEKGSKGWNNLEGLPDSIQNAVDLANKAQETIDGTSIGAVNLLRNSGFTGDYQSEDMIAPDHLDSGSELFSRKLDKWDGDAVVYTDTNGVSGYSVQLGALSQSVKELIAGESYVVSFKARGSVVNVSCGDFSVVQKLASGFVKYAFKFEFSGSKVFAIEGNVRICDLQLERGTIATDWNASPYDNDKSFAEFQSIKYLQDAIVNGNTTVLGGLILSSMLKLGNYKEGKMQKVNAGVSGIYNDENDVAFWGGGTFEQAISTVIKFKQNPNFRPTDEEWRALSNFVVSHGGDLFLHGNVYAENGYFRGRLEQGNEATVLEKDGGGHLANKNIRWTKEGIIYRRAPEIVEWTNVSKFIDGEVPGEINYENGTFFDLVIPFDSTLTQYTLKNPDTKDFAISISLKGALSRRAMSAVLSGTFYVKFFNEDTNEYEYANCERLAIGDHGEGIYNLEWNGTLWNVLGGTASIKDNVAYLGFENLISVKRGQSEETGDDVVSRVVISDGKVVSSNIETPEKMFSVKEESKTKGELEFKMGADKSLKITKDTEKIELFEQNKKSVFELSYWKKFGELTSWVKSLFRRYDSGGYVIASQMESSPDQIKLENFEDAEKTKTTIVTAEKIETTGSVKAVTQILVGESEDSGTLIKPNSITSQLIKAINKTGFAIEVDKSARIFETLHVGGLSDNNTIIKGSGITGGTAVFTGTNDESIKTAGGVKAAKLSLTGSVTKNMFLASPSTADGAPVFRKIVDSDIEGLKSLKSDVGTLKTNVSALQTTTSTLRTDLNTANADINTLKESVNKITSSIEKIEERIKALEDASGDTDGES